jgi:hypothetical protein
LGFVIQRRFFLRLKACEAGRRITTLWRLPKW